MNRFRVKFVVLGCVFVAITAGCNREPEVKNATVLVYEVDASGLEESVTVGELHGYVRDTLIPLSPNVVVRRGAEDRIEIIIPDKDEADLDKVKQRLRERGLLEFRIVANPADHDYIIGLALQPQQQGRQIVVEEFSDPSKPMQMKTIPVGRWVAVARVQTPVKGVMPFKTPIAGFTLRDAKTKKIVEPPLKNWNDDEAEFEQWLRDQGINDVEVLISVDDGYDFTGADLAAARADVDQMGKPMVSFVVKQRAAGRVRGLTSSNLPEGRITRQLAIVLDDKIMSAPTIQGAFSTNGQITGKFTQAEVDEIVAVVRRGTMNFTLSESPVEERHIGEEGE